MKETLIGKRVIIRGDRSGVEYGTFVETDGRQVVHLANARRIWYWDGAASISQLAAEGTSKPHTTTVRQFVDLTRDSYGATIIRKLPAMYQQ